MRLFCSPDFSPDFSSDSSSGFCCCCYCCRSVFFFDVMLCLLQMAQRAKVKKLLAEAAQERWARLHRDAQLYYNAARKFQSLTRGYLLRKVGNGGSRCVDSLSLLLLLHPFHPACMHHLPTCHIYIYAVPSHSRTHACAFTHTPTTPCDPVRRSNAKSTAPTLCPLTSSWPKQPRLRRWQTSWTTTSFALKLRLLGRGTISR